MKHLKLNNCKECRGCFIGNDEEEYCWEPTKKLTKLITDCYKIFADKIFPQPHMDNIIATTVTEFNQGIINIDWLCPHHEEKIKKQLIPILARIFIKRHIAIETRKFKSFYSRANNASKIVQQTTIDNTTPDEKYTPKCKKQKLK